MVLAFNMESLKEDGNYGVTWLLFFLYGWAIIPFCYLFGYLFDKQGNALLLNFFMHLIFGALISLVIWVLRIIKSTREAAKVIVWFLRLVPSFSFATGILNMSNRTLFAAVEGYKKPKDVYDLDISGGDVMMLAIEGFVYMLLVLLVEKLEGSGKIQKFGSKENTIPFEPKILDDDVEKEALICKGLQP
jgi:ATP-binding cassette subfamily A (ABC1) protein 3